VDFNNDGLIDFSTLKYKETIIQNNHKLTYKRAQNLLKEEGDLPQALRWLRDIASKR